MTARWRVRRDHRVRREDAATLGEGVGNPEALTAGVRALLVMRRQGRTTALSSAKNCSTTGGVPVSGVSWLVVMGPHFSSGISSWILATVASCLGVRSSIGRGAQNCAQSAAGTCAGTLTDARSHCARHRVCHDHEHRVCHRRWNAVWHAGLDQADEQAPEAS